MKKWLAIFIMLCFQPLHATQEQNVEKQNTQKEESTQVPAALGEPLSNDPVSRNVWMHTVQLNLPSGICAAQSEYRKCFEIQDKDCVALSRWFASACLENLTYQIPEIVTVEEGQKWGAAVGSCVHDLYYKFLVNKRIEHKGCPALPSRSPSQPNPSQDLSDPTRPQNHE